MFGKVSRAKDYACIEVEGSRDLLRSHILKVFRPIHFVMFCYAVVLYNNLKPYILHMFDFSGIFIKLHKI